MTHMKKLLLTAVFGFALLWVPSISAQMHKVTKPENVVRAVGVYEWTGDLAKPTGIRFVPVTVFIDGEIQDGGIYLPRPIPFALLNGNIYELEDAGLPKGTLELESALNTTPIEGAPAAPFIQGWTAYGSYKSPAPEKKATTLKPSRTLSTITSSGGTSKVDSNTSSDQKNTDQKTADTKSSTVDSDRPTMRRRTPSDDTPASTPSTTTSTTTDDDDKAERPTLRRRSPEDTKNDKQKKKNETASVISTGSLNEDPDRPRLKHNTEAKDTDDLPKLLGVPPDMKQMVAVSDAKNRDPHPFARPWEDATERTSILAKMQAFARAKLADYGSVPGITPPTAIAGNTSVGGTTALPTSSKPGTSTATSIEGSGPPKLKRGVPTDNTLGNIAPPSTPSAVKPAATAASKAEAVSTKSNNTAAAKRRVAATHAAPITLADEQLKGYLLSYGGAPTYVYSAHTIESGSVMRYVTIVAQADALGQLQLALASVTDAAHLDKTPWMRLVDAVDVEASNRASLLFELRGQSGRQFALYRVIAAKPEQIFITSGGQ